MIDVRVKYVSSLTAFERRFAYPLVTIARHLAAAMVARIRRGQGADRALSPLGAHSTDKPGSGLFWVRLGQKQPDGAVVKVDGGRFDGWAGYKSYKAYAQALGGGPRDLEDTGAFLRSIAVRVISPSKVKVAPYGSHTSPSGQRMSSTAVGYLSSRYEPKPLLHPSSREVTEAARILFAEVEGQAIEAAAIAGVGTSARRAAASINRRASKLLGG